jgi:hypothetical protein
VRVVDESNFPLVAVVPPTVEEAPTPTGVAVEGVAAVPEVQEEQKEGGEES